MAMGKLLYEVKGGGHGQAISKSEVQSAADGVLQPLMDLLDCKALVNFVILWLQGQGQVLFSLKALLMFFH